MSGNNVVVHERYRSFCLKFYLSQVSYRYGNFVVIIHLLEISWLFISKDIFHADQFFNYLSFVTISALEPQISFVICFSIIYLILNRFEMPSRQILAK